MKYLVFVLLTLFLSVVACDSNSGTDTIVSSTAVITLDAPTDEPSTQVPTSGSTVVPVTLISELDKDKLIASLLTTNDFPPGWSGRGPGYESYTPVETYPFACKELEIRYTGEAFDEFEKGSSGPFFGHNIYVYSSENDAIEALADIATVASECAEWTNEIGNHTLSSLSFPSLGDSTVAVQINGTLQGGPVSTSGRVYISDVIRIRDRNVIISVSNTTLLDDFDADIGDSELIHEMAVLALERFNQNK